MNRRQAEAGIHGKSYKNDCLSGLAPGATLSLGNGKGYGNGGAVEREEKHKQLSLSFHRPLEISQKARDSHIPTAWHRPGWKSGKPKSGFPLSHAGLATTATVCPDLEPKTKKGDRPLRGLLLIFQDHLVLETGTDFRSILRLENAKQTLVTKLLQSIFVLPRPLGSKRRPIPCCNASSKLFNTATSD
jgi:hypothetical protein